MSQTARALLLPIYDTAISAETIADWAWTIDVDFRPGALPQKLPDSAPRVNPQKVTELLALSVHSRDAFQPVTVDKSSAAYWHALCCVATEMCKWD
jgi:hypothetical protein